MNYYENRKEALKRITEMFAEKKSEKEIIRAIGYGFGYGETAIKKMIKQVIL